MLRLLHDMWKPYSFRVTRICCVKMIQVTDVMLNDRLIEISFPHTHTIFNLSVWYVVTG